MKTVLIDFDGVIHSYVSGWQGKQNIPDPPHPGAMPFLIQLIDHESIEPVIWTSRVHAMEGNPDAIAEAEQAEQAIRNWLLLHGLTASEVDQLKITNDKPPATMIIDDRAFRFEGGFPSIDYLLSFRPWKSGTTPHSRQALASENEELHSRIQWLINNWPVPLEDDGITFPDGEFWRKDG